jgi:hypothetical protein
MLIGQCKAPVNIYFKAFLVFTLIQCVTNQFPIQ